MQQDNFEKLVSDLVSKVYPKAKVQTAKGLNEAEVKSARRFDEPEVYDELKTLINPPLYFLVPESECKSVYETIIQQLPNDIFCYYSQAHLSEGDDLAQKRIVMLNSDNPYYALVWEGVYSYDSDLSNENISSHFDYLLSEYPIRIQEISVDTVSGIITEDLTKAKAKKLAKLMFEMNPETANFESENEEDEEDLDYEDDAPYFIEKLCKHLMQEKTFSYWWD